MNAILISYISINNIASVLKQVRCCNEFTLDGGV
jgi:hypothetical protein